MDINTKNVDFQQLSGSSCNISNIRARDPCARSRFSRRCPSDLMKQEPCNTWPCPVDCVVSDWVTDGDCSVSCGGGLQVRLRVACFIDWIICIL